MTLEPLAGGSWALVSPVNIGLYVQDQRVLVIDTGLGKDSSKKLLSQVAGQGWTLSAIFNTHSNADHAGGNAFLQDAVPGLQAYAPRAEAAVIRDPWLEPSFLWGGFPLRQMRNKLLEAPASRCLDLPPTGIPGWEGLTVVPLPGHFFQQAGILTPDGVFYAGDALVSQANLEKHPVSFVYDLAAYRQTLEMLLTMDFHILVPGHAPPTKEAGPLVRANLDKSREIEIFLGETLAESMTFDQIFRRLCLVYQIRLDHNQYALTACTLRSYLSFMEARGSIRFWFEDGQMLWQNNGGSSQAPTVT